MAAENHIYTGDIKDKAVSTSSLNTRIDINKKYQSKNFEVINRSLLFSAMGIFGFYCSLFVQKFFFPLNKETFLNYDHNSLFINNIIKKN